MWTPHQPRPPPGYFRNRDCIPVERRGDATYAGTAAIDLVLRELIAVSGVDRVRWRLDMVAGPKPTKKGRPEYEEWEKERLLAWADFKLDGRSRADRVKRLAADLSESRGKTITPASLERMLYKWKKELAQPTDQ